MKSTLEVKEDGKDKPSPESAKCSYCGWEKQDHASGGKCYHYSDQDTDYFYKDKFFKPSPEKEPEKLREESQEELIDELVSHTFGASILGRKKIAQKFLLTRKP